MGTEPSCACEESGHSAAQPTNDSNLRDTSH